MASRNLTKKFETLRAAARQRRPHYLSEEKSLLGPSDTTSNGVTTAASTTIQPVMPPEWVDIVDGIHADMKSVKDSCEYQSQQIQLLCNQQNAGN